MGRERSGTREYLYVSVACMMFVLLAGCSGLKDMKAKSEVRERLVMAQRLFNEGDYETSLQVNQKVLSEYDNVPPADEALFNAAIIYAHYGYAKRDYRKSLTNFQRVVKVFPQSPLAGQAKAWIGMLQENERLNRETEESIRSIKRSRQEREKLSREVEELTRAIAKSKQVDIEIDKKRRNF